MQLQLAQARDQPRAYPPTGSQLQPVNPGLPGPAPVASSNLPGLQQMQPQLAGLSPVQYQALLRSLGPGQLEQLMRQPNLNPGLNPANPLDPVQGYPSGLTQQSRMGAPGSQNALPSQQAKASSLQYQLLLNSLNAQRPPVASRASGGLPDYNSIPLARSPGPQALQHQPEAKNGDPASTDYRRLQQLLGAGGKDVSHEMLVKLQQELSQRGQADRLQVRILCLLIKS